MHTEISTFKNCSQKTASRILAFKNWLRNTSSTRLAKTIAKGWQNWSTKDSLYLKTIFQHFRLKKNWLTCSSPASLLNSTLGHSQVRYKAVSRLPDVRFSKFQNLNGLTFYQLQLCFSSRPPQSVRWCRKSPMNFWGLTSSKPFWLNPGSFPELVFILSRHLKGLHNP